MKRLHKLPEHGIIPEMGLGAATPDNHNCSIEGLVNVSKCTCRSCFCSQHPGAGATTGGGDVIGNTRFLECCKRHHEFLVPESFRGNRDQDLHTVRRNFWSYKGIGIPCKRYQPYLVSPILSRTLFLLISASIWVVLISS